MTLNATATSESISDLLSQRLGQRRHAMWFGQARLELNQQGLHVEAGSQFAADWINAHFQDDLQAIADRVVGSPVAISVKVREDWAGDPGSSDPADDATHPPGQSAPSGRSTLPPPPKRSSRSSGRRSRSSTASIHRLEAFVVGPSNELAWSASSRVAGEGGACPVSPLFIHSGCGLGKTHLLQGICRRYRECFGQHDPVRYVTGEQFTNEYIASIRDRRIEEFRRNMRRLSLLAIDDIHFLGDKVKTQAEFLHTLDAIQLSGARIILASDSHPHKIQGFTKGLVSRFLSGMVVEIERPNRDTRRTLIQHMAAARKLQLDEPALELVASRCLGSVREIQGALTRLSALVQVRGLNSDRIGVEVVAQVFEHFGESSQPIGLDRIVTAVCQALHLVKGDLSGRERSPRISLGRGLVACLARRLTDFSYPEIARILGRRNHSSAHAATQRIELLAREGRTVRLPDSGGEAGQVPVRELLDRLRHTITHP